MMAGNNDNQNNVQKIGSITSGKIWKPVTFKIIYKFPKHSTDNKQLVKCLIADDSGLIILLSKDEKAYDFLKVNQSYTILAGGCSSKLVNLKFRHLYIHPNGVELWVFDKDKIVPEFITDVAKSCLNFQFTSLSKLAKDNNFDILARVDWQGPVEDGRNGIQLKPVLLIDESVGKKQTLKCRLIGDHRKLIRSKGQIIAIFNAFVGADGSDLVVHINSNSAAFVVTTEDMEWILSAEQRQLKSNLVKTKLPSRSSITPENDQENANHEIDYQFDADPREELLLELDQVSLPSPSKVSKLENDTRSPLSVTSVASSPKNPVICDNIQKLKSLLGSKRRSGLDIEITGIHMCPGFVIRRYLGCAKCSKSLRAQDGNYICYGKKCCKDSNSDAKNYRNDALQRKSFYLLKNLKIKDDSDEVQDNLIAYNTTIQEFLQKDADEFQSDSLAMEYFISRTQDQRLSMVLRATRLGVGSDLKNRPWELTVVKLSWMNTDNDDVMWGSPLPIMPEIEDTSPFSNDEIYIRTFLAKRIPFPVVVRSGDSDNRLPQNEEEEYIHTKKPRGIALHICTAEGRNGSHMDQQTFQELFEQLQYIVITIVDAKVHELKFHIEECRNRMMNDAFESFVLCISGHGLSNTIRLADQFLVNIWTDIIYQFDDTNFPQFRGKPKIVLVNACQNFATDQHPIPFSNPTSSPNHPDFLVCIATSPGFQTFRNATIGTHFMRTLACVFMRHAANMEIRKLFNLVAKTLHSPDESALQQPQLPEIRDFIFSKQFFFRL